jgi:hypothetical protein
MHKAPNLLQDDLVDPQKRKAWEAQKRAEVQQQQGQQPQQQPQQQQAQAPIDPNNRVFLVNNMARPVHIPEGPGHRAVIIDGQLAVSAKGPFEQMSRQELEANYMLQDMMSQPVSKVNPALKNVPKIEEIDEPTFYKRRRDYQAGKILREAEYAKEHNNVAKHEDGTVDEDDANFELRKINPRIVRAQG